MVIKHNTIDTMNITVRQIVGRVLFSLIVFGDNFQIGMGYEFLFHKVEKLKNYVLLSVGLVVTIL
jgi:hypothetical protein